MPSGLRVVSLAPSATETLMALGAGEDLVDVTGPGTAGVLAVAPDVVVADPVEQRAADLDALREAGLVVHETSTRSVADVPGLVRGLADLVGRPDAAAPLLDDLAAARAEAAARAPATRVVALALVARDPWRGVGPDIYVDDLLWQCGFANALSGFADREPELDPALLLGADVALLPDDAFGPDDVAAVADLVGADVARRLVDGALLSRPGVRTAAALRTLSALAAELAA